MQSLHQPSRRFFQLTLIAAFALLAALTGCNSQSDLEEAKILVHKKKIEAEAKELKRKREEAAAAAASASPTGTPSASPSPTPTAGEDAGEESEVIDQIPTSPSPSPVPEESEEAMLKDLLVAELEADRIDVQAEPAAGPLHEFFTNEPAANEGGADRRSSNNNLIGGIVRRGDPEITGGEPPSGDAAEDDVIIDEPQAAALPRRFVQGQARGFVMLPAMQIEARQSIERQVQTLLDAKIRQVFIAVLTDGTFGQDFNYLSIILRRLSFERREVSLLVYLTNGATMREWDTTEIDAGFNRIDPTYFRDLIRFDGGTREMFRAMARKVKPVLELNEKLGPRNRNYISVMLEDNLEYESYRAMREIAAAELGALGTIVRNPCPGCWAGNDTESGGDPIELHTVESVETLPAGSGFSLDGVGYRYEWESPGITVGPDHLPRLLEDSARRNHRYFALWRAPRQGIDAGPRKHPRNRIYEVPSREQMEADIGFLRHGLTPEE